MSLETEKDAPTQTKIRELIGTSASDDLTISRETPDNESSTRGWNNVINYTLIEWGKSPDSLEDEGIEAPDTTTVRRACEIAIALRDSGFSCPDRVLPNGNGGIVFEKEMGARLFTYEIESDGPIEYREFLQGRLVRQSSVN